MLSMLRYLSDHDQVQDVVFYHQCRDVSDIPCKSELDALNREHPGLKVLISLSQAPIDWFGLKGRLTLPHLKQVENLSDRQVFVCGPDGFMQNAKQFLAQHGLPEDQYHQEAFGVARTATRAEKTIHISINGQSFIGDNQRSLLEQAEDNGIAIANSCRAGLCGACKVTVESGKYHQPDVPALQAIGETERVAMACCCVPESDIDVVS